MMFTGVCHSHPRHAFFSHTPPISLTLTVLLRKTDLGVEKEKKEKEFWRIITVPPINLTPGK